MRRLVSLVVLAACHDSSPKAIDAPVVPIDGPADVAAPDASTVHEVALFPVTVNRDVDLLFMVDDSPSTLDKQTNLKAGFPTFVSTLTAVAGGLPNVHIGVITSDVGTKGAADASPGPSIGSGTGACSGLGKAGNLQTSGATSLTGNYIIDLAGSGEARTTNYSGTLADTFSAIASVGAAGCGFEQPIEAAKLALNNNPSNAGFLRPGASLAIIFLTDEDDCSIAHSTLFGSDTATFGPLQSFRCTRFGVTCDQGGATTDEMNNIGAKSSCHSNDTSPYLTHVADYITFFSSLKADPGQLLVAAIAGDTSPFAVALRMPPGGGTGVPALVHSCTYTDSSNMIEVGDPATRIAQLVGAFRRQQFSTVCSPDLTQPMTDLAQAVGQMVGVPCITKPIADVSQCKVYDETPNVAPVEIPSCSGGAQTCYTLATDATACPAAQHYILTVTRAAAPTPDTSVSVQCP